jgi:hypothetical protein
VELGNGFLTRASWSADELAMLAGKWVVDNQGVAEKARLLADEINFKREG